MLLLLVLLLHLLYGLLGQLGRDGDHHWRGGQLRLDRLLAGRRLRGDRNYRNWLLSGVKVRLLLLLRGNWEGLPGLLMIRRSVSNGQRVFALGSVDCMALDVLAQMVAAHESLVTHGARETFFSSVSAKMAG